MTPNLRYVEYPPVAAIAAHVECIWTLEGQGSSEPDHIVPDGRAELIWNLADPFWRWNGDGEPRRQAAALLVGQITTAFHLAPGRNISLVAVRFRPAALGSFLRGVAAAELTDLDVPIDDVVGRRYREIADILAERQPADRVSGLQAALVADLRRATPVDEVVTSCVDAIMSTHGRTGVQRLAELSGLSRRQLERRFLAAVGIGPKRLARLARFQHLISRIHSAPVGGWSGLAVSCGYYDQAHLIRDFREFAQRTPTEHLALDDLSISQLFLASPQGR